ncbi:hypothetical protein AMIS_34290 [Actinoplanes missouriensis 431]|uniref:Uncharacterized protein n=1 Tax=Actinoplanes missouriensis (strain ATCC 14538 / DSM 43046 / CBS 188.64 / JCM 3121 / NBRC 102363 / NCIMB 12654 / NRRL B-3342 / UNCC 431) TaxID=512565 RepID=I0H6L2_ACTM4|nr:hypothetical protein [Actinoplanes missouriensis]BAL88649.1 hypothetical protein AMIS_34290 [Actinoplanes missouriensis 431]
MAPKLAVAALAALTLACLAGVAPAAAHGARQWAVSGVEPLGQPVAVGAAIIGYERRDQQVYIRSRSPETGAALWEAEAVPGVPVRAGRWVVYREPQPEFGDGYTSLVVADPLTGTQAQRSPTMIFQGEPRSCFGDGAVCVTAAPAQGEPMHGYRLNLTSGAFIPAAEGISGEGLITIGTELALVRDGAVLWRRPDPKATRWTLVPTGPGAPSGPGAPAAGAGPSGPGAPPAGGVWVGSTPTGSVGLDAADGTLLWTSAGVLRDCGIPLRAPTIRCRDGRIEAFDPITGTARWSVPLRGPVEVAGDDAIVIRGVSISLATGKRGNASGPRWCFTGGLASVCGHDGVPPVSAWTAIGAVAAGHVVVATPAGYLGMPAA